MTDNTYTVVYLSQEKHFTLRVYSGAGEKIVGTSKVCCKHKKRWREFGSRKMTVIGWNVLHQANMQRRKRSNHEQWNTLTETTQRSHPSKSPLCSQPITHKGSHSQLQSSQLKSTEGKESQSQPSQDKSARSNQSQLHWTTQSVTRMLNDNNQQLLRWCRWYTVNVV